MIAPNANEVSLKPMGKGPACIYVWNYNDVILSAMASQITGISTVYSTVCSGADKRKQHSSAPLDFVREIYRPAQRVSNADFFPFDDVILMWLKTKHNTAQCRVPILWGILWQWPWPIFIKPDQLDPWIKDQIEKASLSTIFPLQLRNFVAYGKDTPSHMTQHYITVRIKHIDGLVQDYSNSIAIAMELLQSCTTPSIQHTGEWFPGDYQSMDQADRIWQTRDQAKFTHIYILLL